MEVRQAEASSRFSKGGPNEDLLCSVQPGSGSHVISTNITVVGYLSSSVYFLINTTSSGFSKHLLDICAIKSSGTKGNKDEEHTNRTPSNALPPPELPKHFSHVSSPSATAKSNEVAMGTAFPFHNWEGWESERLGEFLNHTVNKCLKFSRTRTGFSLYSVLNFTVLPHPFLHMVIWHTS